MSEVESLLDTAFSAYNNNRLAEAESLARSVLNILPTHGDALYLLGLIAFQAGALEPAEQLLYQAVKLYPNTENYVLSLASVLQKRGRLEEALSYYEKFPDNPLVLSQMGIIYLQQGKDDFAKSAFDKASSLDPTNVSCLIGKALLERKHHDSDRALYYLLEASGIQKTPEVLYQLALQYRLNGDFQKALQYAKQAVLSLPLASFYNELGLCLEKSGHYDEALEAYIQATEKDPYYADAFFNQGNMYRLKGLDLAAEDSFKRALSLDHKFLEAHHNLASLLYKQNRLTEALDHYREALILNPKHISSLFNLAIILEKIENYQEALGLYFNILSLKESPKTIDFRIAYCLTELYRQDKKNKKIITQFIKGWIKHFPDNKIAQHTYNALIGHKISSQDARRYAELLYEAFADSYDEIMQKIENKTIQETVEMIKDKKYKNVLDLGCGTGAFGKELKENFNKLTGVDLSQNMLKKAALTQSYSQLIHQDAVSFLKQDKKKYDLISAIELFCYVPNVSELLSLIPKHLSQKGMLIFSVEETKKKECVLDPTGRYLYSRSYIENVLKEVGLSIVHMKSIQLRKEGNGYANGFIVLCALK